MPPNIRCCVHLDTLTAYWMCLETDEDGFVDRFIDRNGGLGSKSVRLRSSRPRNGLSHRHCLQLSPKSTKEIDLPASI